MDKPHGEMNVLDGLWTSRATSHIPLKDVSAHLTPKTVGDAINLAYETLKRAGYEDPKVAIAAINPHGGDSGTCGREEIDVLQPAVAKANAEGKSIVGPFPSDTLFIRAFKGDFDAVVKSVNLVPTPVMRSAFSAIVFAALLPVTPKPPRLRG